MCMGQGNVSSSSDAPVCRVHSISQRKSPLFNIVLSGGVWDTEELIWAGSDTEFFLSLIFCLSTA